MPPRPTPPAPTFAASWLTRIALCWALSVVGGRMMTSDALREPWDVVPGAMPSLRHPGPATALVFDLLAAVPALLVLARRAIDRSYPIRFRWSPPLLLLLGLFCTASAFWAADKFAAVVTGLHVVAAAVLLWSMSQLVRSWPQFRLVSAFAGGLLLVLVAHSMAYTFMDVPQNKAYWEQNKTAILKERGWAPDSFDAKAFEHKLLAGELVGFFNSPNTFAAVGVLLFSACVGIGIFRVRAGDNPNWILISIAAAGALAWVLYEARSKTSVATPVIGVAVVAVWAAFGHRLKSVPGRTYLTGLAVVTSVALATVGTGLRTGHLLAGHFSNSLDFRWKYWTASAAVFRDHPLLGVGYGNFGGAYLAHRRPEAPEEVKDPHNLIVRCFTELGIFGGLLLLGWLARLGWELLRPADEFPDSTDRPPTTYEPMVISAIAMLVGMIAATDFGFSIAGQLLTMMRYLIYGLVLLLGALAGSMFDPAGRSIDPRPAKWIYACLATGLGLFFVQNMIDFSWGEPGALTVLGALAGSAVGMTGRPSAGKPVPTVAAVAGLGIAVVAWIAVAGAVVFPIIQAESLAASADDLIAAAAPDAGSARQFRDAIDLYRQATDVVPYNADYRYRLARADTLVQSPTTLADMAAAIKADPTLIPALLIDARYRLRQESPDQAAVRRDFDTAIRLNPNDVSVRRDYAEALDRFGDPVAAAAQYRAALAANDALPPEETKRLPPDQVETLRKLADRHGN